MRRGNRATNVGITSCRQAWARPRLPALLQGYEMKRHTDPFTGETDRDYEPFWGGFMAPPFRPVHGERGR